MSYYIDRYVKFGKEATWGTSVNPTSFFNYLLDFEGGITEARVEEPVIAGFRDAKSRVFMQREVTGLARSQLQSAKFFEFALGTVALSGTGANSLPATITTTSTLPSFTYQRVYRPVKGTEENALTLIGMKVSSWELTLEQGEDVEVEYTLAGKDGSLDAVTYSAPTVNFTLNPFAFYEGVLAWGTTTISPFRRIVISGDNNLEARFAAGGTIGQVFTCQELREGACDISGRFTLDQPLSTYAAEVLKRGEGTLILTLTTAVGTIEITLNNVALEEYSEAFSGMEPIEVEFPFTCRRMTASKGAITVIQSGTGAWADLAY